MAAAGVAPSASNPARSVATLAPEARISARRSRPSSRPWKKRRPPPNSTSTPEAIIWEAISASSARLSTWDAKDAGVACVMRLVATRPVAMPRASAASRTVRHGVLSAFTPMAPL